MESGKLLKVLKTPTRRVPCLGVCAIKDPHDMDSTGPAHRVCKRCREAAAKRDVPPILQRACRAVASEESDL